MTYCKFVTMTANFGLRCISLTKPSNWKSTPAPAPAPAPAAVNCQPSNFTLVSFVSFDELFFTTNTPLKQVYIPSSENRHIHTFAKFSMGYISCKAESSIATSESHASTSSSSFHGKFKEKPIKFQEFSYEDLELATSNFSGTNLLGRGSHGLVFKGVLRSGRLVAVKKPSRSCQTMEVCENPNEFENEIEILSKLQSPGLVNLIGFTKNGSQDRLLVVEYMSNGNLYDILHSNPQPPTWGRRVKLALQTAKAVDTLHSLFPPVIHRDIKSANILIDKNFNARLGDFGLALRCVDDSKLRSTPPAGTMGYLDPGYVTPDNLSTKTDVFSFGILLLEIISGRKAIDMGHSPPYVVDWAVPLIRKGKVLAVYDPRVGPPKDASVRKMLAMVAAKCVRSNRERRPSMKQVVLCLSELCRLAPLHVWNAFANPCLMIEDVGRTIQSRNALSNSTINDGEKANHDCRDAQLGRAVKSLTVSSDLGLRCDLVELMAGQDGETKLHSENS